MSKQVTVNTAPAVGFLGLLFIVLLVLKLTKLATISWFWVFVPLIIGPAIVLLVLLVIGLVLAGVAIYDFMPGQRLKRKGRRLK